MTTSTSIRATVVGPQDIGDHLDGMVPMSPIVGWMTGGDAPRVADPFAILGLPSSATAAEVLLARRRLAKRLHPDALVGRNEDERRVAATRLAEINRAVELALASLSSPAQAAITTPPAGPPDDGAVVSFSIEALPVEAFELLLLAMSAIGDPRVVDEPYLLRGLVDDPSLCLCRIELVPEAGGTIATVEVQPMTRSAVPPPSAVAVAGRLIAEIEALGPE
jgi:hypothetical protein